MCGIIERPVMTLHLPRKRGARLIRIAADGDDCVYRLREKVVHVLGNMRRNINADLAHRFDRERMDVTSGFAAGAGDGDDVTSRLTQNSFREMAATGVAGAEDENCLLICCYSHK